jgi:hypothetical protein
MNIPAFDQPCFYLSELSPPQRRFFDDLEAKLQRGECPNVDGNVSYLFLFVYRLINSVNERGFESVHDYLIRFAEAYIYVKKPDFSFYCRAWAYDCLLGQKKYKRYLEKTEPPSPLGLSTHPSNLRLNVQEHCGLEANAVDILRMFGGRNSKFIREHVGLYRDCVQEVFAQEAAKQGPWFPVLHAGATQPATLYPHHLFAGAVIPSMIPLEFGLRCFYVSAVDVKVMGLAKAAENKARLQIGVPQVGEGWVSETALFRALQVHFFQTVTVQHGQPLWLGRQHFDVWFPDWNIAVEYHGEQHFQAVEFFGGTEAFEATVRRDARKAALARENRVTLLIATKDSDQSELIAEIEKILSQRGPALPPSAL